MEIQARLAFAQRLHEICEDRKLPQRGRQTALAKRFGVSYQAVKKWLDGVGYPNTDLVVSIAEWGEVNVNWLLQGIGPKRGERIDSSKLAIAEGIAELPLDDRQQVLDFIRYKFEKADGWFAGEKLGRYMAMLDRLGKMPKPPST
jgi:transcriptional regulator with XRE-family HTH domain